MAEALSKSNPIARKEHICNYCAQVIKKGEQYQKQGIVNDGSAYTWRNHVHCQKIAEYFDMFDDDNELTGEDFRDQAWEIYKLDHPDAKWDRGKEIPATIEYCLELMEKGK